MESMQTRTLQANSRSTQKPTPPKSAPVERAAASPQNDSAPQFEFSKVSIYPQLPRPAATGEPPPGQSRGGDGGLPLPDGLRATMTQAYQTDFARVRLFPSSPLTDAHGAEAFTRGDDIHFARGAYDPVGRRGQELLGHELAHVVQQRQGRVSGAATVGGVNSEHALEHEAELAGRYVVRGQPLAGLGVARGAAAAPTLGHAAIQCRKRHAKPTKPAKSEEPTESEESASSGHTIKIEPGKRVNILEPNADLPLSMRLALQSQNKPLTELASEQEAREKVPALTPQVEAFLKTLPYGPGEEGEPHKEYVGYEASEGIADDLARLGSTGIELAKKLYRQRHDITLRQLFVQTGNRNPGFVRIMALLAFGHETGDEVALGRAIIPDRVHDAAIPRVIGKVLAGNRARLVRRYGRAFSAIGLGEDWEESTALRVHLTRALGGVLDWLTNDDDTGLATALTLLDHDLTTAEKIYFRSLAVRGTRTKDVLDSVQSTWKKGFGEFDRLVKDWDNFVRSRQGWNDKSGKAWTSYDLKGALTNTFSGELSFEDKDLVLAIFDAYEKGLPDKVSRDQRRTAGAGQAEAVQREEEDLQLQAAWKSIDAAGSAFSSLTNDEQVQSGVQTIVAIWEARIARAKAAKKTAEVKELELKWSSARELLDMHTGLASQSPAQRDKTRLLIQGGDSLLSKVWAECQLGHYAEAVKLMTRGWIQGKVAQFHREAQNTKDLKGGILPPKVVIPLLIPGSDQQYWRFMSLALDSSEDPSIHAGVNRLTVELGGVPGGGPAIRSTADSELAGLYEFFQEFTHTDPDLRKEILRGFLRDLGFSHMNEENTRPGGQFILYLQLSKFEEASNFEKICGLLAPGQSRQERAEQVHRERAAREKSFGAKALRFTTDAVAGLTGEREGYEMDRSVAVIDDLVAGSGEQQVAATGESSVDALLDRRIGQFEEELEGYAGQQVAVTQAIAGSVELAFELAVSVITGGQGVFAVLSSVGSTLMNKFTSEALLGENYQLYSPGNIRDVIVAAVSSSLDELGDIRSRIEKAVAFENTRWFANQVEKGAKSEKWAKIFGNAAQNVTAGIADGTINSLTTMMANALLAQQYPTPEALAAEVRRVLIGALSRGLHAPGTAFNNPGGFKDDTLTFGKRFDVNLAFKMWVKQCEGTGKKLAELLASDTSNQTVWEMLDKVATPQIKGIATAYLKAYASATGQQRKATARLADVNEILGQDKGAYAELARVLSGSMNLESAHEQHQAGGAAQHKGVLADAAKDARKAGVPAPTSIEQLAGTSREKSLKAIAPNIAEYAAAKKTNDARLLILDYRKLLGEEGKEPVKTRQLIQQLVQKARERAEDKEGEKQVSSEELTLILAELMLRQRPGAESGQ